MLGTLLGGRLAELKKRYDSLRRTASRSESVAARTA